MKRGIVRVYFLPGQDAKYVNTLDGHGRMEHAFMDFSLDDSIPVRVHIPDLCMEVDITPSGVSISYHDRHLLAQECRGIE